MQKHVQLKHKRVLIATGLFAHTRNPNYFGEVMIYVGFACFSGNYSLFGYCLAVWLLLFCPNMVNKDASMCRYPEWPAWAQRTGLLVPWPPALLADVATQALSLRPAQAKEA